MNSIANSTAPKNPANYAYGEIGEPIRENEIHAWLERLVTELRASTIRENEEDLGRNFYSSVTFTLIEGSRRTV